MFPFFNLNECPENISESYKALLYSDMKNQWKTKTLLKWKRLRRQSKNSLVSLKVSKNGTGVESLLVFLPEKLEHAQVMNHFIKSLTGKTMVHFICDEDAKQHYPEALQGNIISFSEKDINSWGVIGVGLFRDKVSNIKIDALVDLNMEENLLFKELSLGIDTPLKIGFQTPYADEYYSVLISHKKGEFLEKSFETLRKFIGIL